VLNLGAAGGLPPSDVEVGMGDILGTLLDFKET
jgi:hypothetical protein